MAEARANWGAARANLAVANDEKNKLTAGAKPTLDSAAVNEQTGNASITLDGLTNVSGQIPQAPQ